MKLNRVAMLKLSFDDLKIKEIGKHAEIYKFLSKRRRQFFE